MQEKLENICKQRVQPSKSLSSFWFCCQYPLINYFVSGPKTYCSLSDIIVFWCYKDGLKKVKDWYVAPKGLNLSLICQVETFITSSGNSVNNAPKITASFAWSLHQHTVCHFNENYKWNGYFILLWLGEIICLTGFIGILSSDVVRRPQNLSPFFEIT